MDSFFSSSTLFNIVLAVIWFISGIRDFQGKDPLIKLPFNSTSATLSTARSGRKRTAYSTCSMLSPF